ncbi:MAG: S8 family peptidase [Flavobacteriales bacterium]|nr:S8 family peptidase [Flavobacteriales bacterium]
MAKKDFPIQVVEIRATDHRPPVIVRPGPAKLFGPVDKETRQSLCLQLAEVHDYFQDYFQRWPNIPAVIKVTLKEEALAKSHRPTGLLTRSTCPIIGTLDFGEILVSATLVGISRLSQKINTTQAKKPIANISAIEKIEPYRVQDNRLYDLDSLAKHDISLKIHTFDHHQSDTNQRINSALIEYAHSLGVELEGVNYGARCSFFKAPSVSSEVKKALESFIGLQSLEPMPSYRPGDFELQSSRIGMVDEMLLPPPDPEIEYPIVGVIDSGVCPNSVLLSPWVIDKEEYVDRELQDNVHGTMVAGLIAGAHSLNHNDDRFPDAQAKIVDVTVFEKDSALQEDVLIAILEDVIPKHPEVHVWNLSLGGSTPTSRFEFSDFACFLDEMHDTYQCLFVVASGNHSFMQKWPKVNDTQGVDRVSSPGDSIRSLTVGALANSHNANSLSKTGEPSPFSRGGPGPCFIPKPEVTHYGGNCSENGTYAQTGVLSIGPNNSLCETLGTSFATPLVSAQAAVLWSYLDTADSPSTPERIKALLIHSALIASDKVTTETINDYGFGRPTDVIDALYCDPNTITLMFETDLRHGGHEFERWPFPIADCLRTLEGKFQGEILMTVAYSPITDASFKSEYCRTNVDVGMGSYVLIEDADGSKKYKFDSAVPVAPKDMKQLYEKHQIENGFKWSPVKAYYAMFPRGKAIEIWRLKMKVTRRAELETPDQPQRATLLLTIRAKTADQPVYNETIQAMNQVGWITHNIDQHIEIRT